MDNPRVEREAKLQALDLLRLVLWFGILTAAVEVTFLAAIKLGSLASAPVGWANPDDRLRHSYLWLSLHVVWMAPLMLSFVLALPAAILALAGRVNQRVFSLHIVSGVLAFVCWCSLLYIYPRLYDIAVVLLAVGLAVQVARWIDTHQETFLRVVRKTTPWMVAALLFVAVAMNAGTILRERISSASASAPGSSAKNVLLLILDTVRASNLSLYGYPRETTPNIERLAAGGVTFDRAIATSPWTLPSHLSMFTGRLPYEFNANFLIPYRGQHRTLAEEMAAQGYVTAGFAANLVYCAWESGITRGFLHYDAYQISATEFLKSFALGRRLDRSPALHGLFAHYDVFGEKDAKVVTNEFLNWLEVRPQDRPFFAFLNFMDPHEPYLPPARFEQKFGTGTPRRHDLNNYFLRWTARAGRTLMSPEELNAEVAAYDGTIAYVDEQVGVLIDRLRDEGLLQNTVVIVASDHGEQFGEHGLHVHGNSLFLPNLHVPLVVASGDRLPGGMRVGTPVSIRDIPATVMSLSGVAGDNPFPGKSLDRYWTDVAADSIDAGQVVFSELTDIRGTPTTKSLIVGRYHYIWGENRVEGLFDLNSDPGELTNLVSRENLDLVTSMRRLMAPHIRNDAALWERLPQND